MPDEEQTTGTAEVGNAAETPTTGTPADGNAESLDTLRERISNLQNQQSQWLAEKTNYENLKREKEQGAWQSPPPPTTNGDDADLNIAFMELQQLANMGDRQAKLQLAQVREARELRAQNAYLQDKLDVPESEREEVEQIARKEGVTLRIARRLRKAEKAEESERRAAEAEKKLAMSAQNPRVATATVTGIPAADVQDGKVIRRADWAAVLKKVRDEQGDQAAGALVRRKDAGEIRLAD